MTKKIEKVGVPVLLAMVCLTMTGCNYPGSILCPIDLSTLPSDVSLFVQQLAQEAVAAFLF